MRLEFKGVELTYTAHNKTNDATYRAVGKRTENEDDKGFLAGNTAAALNWLKKWATGKPEQPPDAIDKGDILGSWKGTDSFGADLTFHFKEDDAFVVVRNPSTLGRPSVGKYAISGTEVSGEADTKVAFTVEKFGNEIRGEWVYKVNGVSAEFTLKQETPPAGDESKTTD